MKFPVREFRTVLAVVTVIFLAFSAPLAAVDLPGSAVLATGTAVEEGLFAPLVNPAALGVDNARGFAAYFSLPDSDQPARVGLQVNLGGFGYGFVAGDEDESAHRLAFGAGLAKGLYAGVAYDWDESGFEYGDFVLAGLVRPLPYLSMSAQSIIPNAGSKPIGLGVGFRPLTLLGQTGLGNRVTLFADTDLREWTLENWRIGAGLEPVDGVAISAAMVPDDGIISLGLTLVFGPVVGGATGAGTNNGVGEAYGHVGFSGRDRRNLGGLAAPVAVEYKEADFLPEVAPRTFLFPDGSSLGDILSDLKRIETDPAVTAVVFRNQLFLGSFAAILEIRDALEAVKEAGKKVYFYFDFAPRLAYALAAATADRIFLAPSGAVDVRGFSSGGLYLKDFLGEYGVTVVNHRSHGYKSGFDFLSESGMTDEEREAVGAFLRGREAVYRDMIAGGRKTALKKSIEELLAGGPYLTATSALEAGLVDQVAYPDEFEAWMNERPGHRLVDYRRTERFVYDWQAMGGTRRVAVVYAVGTIVPGSGRSGRFIAQESMASTIKALRENPLVSGIIIRVDSSGGALLPSDMIAREIELAVEKNNKPVIVSMAGTAASGGYYIAAKATRIVASPVTMTGSIGVLAIQPNFSGLAERLKLRYDVEKTTPTADFGNPLKPVDPREVEKIRLSISAAYDNFVRFVAEGRKMDRAAVQKAAQGRIWTGADAKDRGLVDQLGGLADAVDAMEEVLGGEVQLETVVPGPSFDPFRTDAWGDWIFGRVRSELPEELGAVLEDYQTLRRFRVGEPLYLMPYRVDDEAWVGLTRQP